MGIPNIIKRIDILIPILDLSEINILDLPKTCQEIEFFTKFLERDMHKEIATCENEKIKTILIRIREITSSIRNDKSLNLIKKNQCKNPKLLEILKEKKEELEKLKNILITIYSNQSQ